MGGVAHATLFLMKMLKVFVPFLFVTSFLVFYYFHIQKYGGGMIDPAGIIAVAEKNLMLTAFGLMMIVVVPVFIMLFAFAWRYRAGNKHAKYSPDFHESKTLEIIWWIVPGFIVFLLAIITWKSTHELDPYKPLVSDKKPITIQVVALDWKWLFIYPDEQIATVNLLQIPKDVPINFRITADAPMNSFWIPQLGGQVYAMGGMTTQLHLMGSKEGDYKGLSANFSGDGFGGMKFIARVSSVSSYEDWLKEVRNSPYALTESEYEMLRKPTSYDGISYYAFSQPGLFQKIVDRYMLPENSFSPDGTQYKVKSHRHDKHDKLE